MISAVTVYCSSSSHVAPVYIEAARQLGVAIARRNWTLVYGGNVLGSMKAVSDGARSEGGKVIGITPQLFIDEGCHDRECQLVLANSMRHRKELMEQHGDAFVALPGGLGTLEEIFEIIVGRQLGYHNKPILLLNIARFYDPLLALLEHGIEQHFIRPRARELYVVADNVDAGIAHLAEAGGA
jgi:uncharacterized protein (TIGR00730 family)